MSLINLKEQKELIIRSWKRCHGLGLLPTDPINDDILRGKDIQELIKENEFLIKHTMSVLGKLYPNIHSIGHVTVIADRDGTIIYKIGKLDVDDALDFMSIGSNWSEEVKGTNAIGLVIHEKKTVITHAEHHFYVNNHFLTCAASPIYSSTGAFIGTVNISARKELFHPFMISLVSIVAEAVQSRLLLEHANREKLLAIKETECTANLHKFPLLTLDHENKILRANQTARRFLGDNCIGTEFKAKDGYKIDIISDDSNKSFRSIVSMDKPNKSTHLTLYQPADIIGSCKKVVKVRNLVKKAALFDYPVIIYGESGTGKELVAQSLHTAGPRATKPFVAVNCSAIPEGLIESELFGYERGAFTGANRDGAPGKFETADGGTIFLDEIGDMSLKAQAALLRVLQEKKVTRIGGEKEKPIDTRVIAATNKNLLEEVQAGRFREDLYYRLKGIFITLPALRDRSDIIELAEFLLTTLDQPSLYLSAEAKQQFLSYHWPGNIRELKSVLMQASFLAEGSEIKAEELQFVDEYEHNTKKMESKEKTSFSLISAEKDVIIRALQSAEWNISKAANILKISRNTLYIKIKKYNLMQKHISYTEI